MTSGPSYLTEKRPRYGVTAIFKTDTGAAMFVRESDMLIKEANLEIPPGQTGSTVIVQVPDTWSKLPEAERAAAASQAWRKIEDLKAAIEIYGGTHALLT